MFEINCELVKEFLKDKTEELIQQVFEYVRDKIIVQSEEICNVHLDI